MPQSNLADQITQTLEAAGIFIAVDQTPAAVTLSGEVDSDDNRQAAIDVATAVTTPAGLSVVDELSVLTVEPDSVFELDEDPDEFLYADESANPEAATARGLGIYPDFTGDPGTTDAQLATEEGLTYFPPTDPVVRPTGDAEEIEIVGGFETTSMDDEEASETTGPRTDEDIADDVRRELEEDALTIDLVIRVDVRGGVVILDGSVPSLDDAENAEAVAARVPDVVEVRERLHIVPAG